MKQSEDRVKLSEIDFIRSPGDKAFLKRLAISGKWSLTENNDLKLRVLASKSDLYGKSLIFKGDIEHKKGDYLRFHIRHSEPLSGIRSGVIELKGRWQADKYNRICFAASKGKGRYDILRFQGAWEVERNNELVYRYKKTYLKTRVKKLHTVIFNGHWDLAGNKLIYRIEGSSKSFFGFKATLQPRSIKSSAGTIRYRLGIGYYERKVFRKFERTITIFGKWTIRQDLKVGFEVSYRGGRRCETVFSIEKVLRKGCLITLSLENIEEGPCEVRVMGGLSIRF